MLPSGSSWSAQEDWEANMGHRETYIPALSLGALTPWYDAAMKWVFREDLFRRPVVEAADLKPGQRVLDLGCGTGTLTMMLKRAQPAAVVTGLDIDATALDLARRKAQQAGVDIEWNLGSAAGLPFADGAFDGVVSSVVIHHLATPLKQAAFAEVHRVLRPGRAFYLLDFAPPRGEMGQALVPALKHFERIDDNLEEGRLPAMMRAAGFTTVEEQGRYVAGALALWQAWKARQV